MSRAHIGGKNTTITFAYMHIGAKYMLKLAEESEEGQLYTLVASLIFNAFTLEAYLNHLGKLRNKEWNEIERRYSKIEKYKLFAEAAEIKFDFSVRPYRTLKELFFFRDRMAHGRTTEEVISTCIDMHEKRLPQIHAKNDWQTFATFETARQSIKDVERLIKELHSMSGYPGNPFNKLGSAIYGVAQEHT
jgi:hypothetical protein